MQYLSNKSCHFLMILISHYVSAGCYWNQWCVQECRGCWSCDERTRWKDFAAAMAATWDQHKDHLFCWPRWLESGMPSVCTVLLTRKWPNAFFKSILSVIFFIVVSNFLVETSKTCSFKALFWCICGAEAKLLLVKQNPVSWVYLGRLIKQKNRHHWQNVVETVES